MALDWNTATLCQYVGPRDQKSVLLGNASRIYPLKNQQILEVFEICPHFPEDMV